MTHMQVSTAEVLWGEYAVTLTLRYHQGDYPHGGWPEWWGWEGCPAQGLHTAILAECEWMNIIRITDALCLLRRP